MQPSISDQIEISNLRSVVTKHVTNKCGKFCLRCNVPLLECNTMTRGQKVLPYTIVLYNSY